MNNNEVILAKKKSSQLFTACLMSKLDRTSRRKSKLFFKTALTLFAQVAVISA